MLKTVDETESMLGLSIIYNLKSLQNNSSVSMPGERNHNSVIHFLKFVFILLAIDGIDQ